MKQFLFLALLFIGCEKDSPTEPKDCAEVVGGNAVKDTCGVCNGDGTSCIDCAGVPAGTNGLCTDGTPVLFQFNQSTLQAYYNFYFVTIDGTPVDSDDWVGAFNGNVCVGSFKWDTSQCNNDVCAVAAMGNDGTDSTTGYLSEFSDTPTFKIYDASAGTYLDAITSETVDVFQNLGIQVIDYLGHCSGASTIDCQGACGGTAVNCQ